MKSVGPWKEKIDVCRNFTTSCAPLYADGHFDFIYVDARHDYKGALVDMEAWWPKLKEGGIMAGHDYMIQVEVKKFTPRKGRYAGAQDWTTNYDGTVDRTGTVVKGAVDQFARERVPPRQVQVGYREYAWNTWAIRK